jgi:hypothetical protein
VDDERLDGLKDARHLGIDRSDDCIDEDFAEASGHLDRMIFELSAARSTGLELKIAGIV